jgi:hypothetical protein
MTFDKGKLLLEKARIPLFRAEAIWFPATSESGVPLRFEDDACYIIGIGRRRAWNLLQGFRDSLLHCTLLF